MDVILIQFIFAQTNEMTAKNVNKNFFRLTTQGTRGLYLLRFRLYFLTTSLSPPGPTPQKFFVGTFAIFQSRFAQK